MMIKISFLILIIVASLLGFSQEKAGNVELMKGKIEDAKVQVDENLQNPEKNIKPETWYLAAYVYTKMAKSEVYGHLEMFPGEKALQFIKKSISLDAEQVLYSEQINVLLDLGPSFYNKAIKNYNLALKDSTINNFKLALRYFEDYFELLETLKNDEKFVKQMIEYNGVSHDNIYFYTGYTSECIGDLTKALKYYSMLIDLNSDIETARTKSKDLAFLYASKIYASQKDYKNSISIIKRGVELYPENDNLVLTAIILYKEADRMDDMIDQMEEVVQKNPNNIKLLFLLARNYTTYGKSFEKSGYIETSEKYYSKAISYYQQAIELHPNDNNMEYSILYNLGVLFFNRGANEYKKGDKIDLEKFQEYFSSSKPLLIKANSIKNNPNIDKMIAKINETLGE